MATTYAQQMLDLLSPATRAAVLAQVAKDDAVNPFTHCPICGLPFHEGECRVHTSYDNSMAIIAAQQAWSRKEEMK